MDCKGINFDFANETTDFASATWLYRWMKRQLQLTASSYAVGAPVPPVPHKGYGPGILSIAVNASGWRPEMKFTVDDNGSHPEKKRLIQPPQEMIHETYER